MGVNSNLRDQATHWVNTGSNGYGGFAFSAPVLLSARWQEHVEISRDEAGEEFVSKAKVFLASNVTPGDYVAEGDRTATSDPTTITGIAYRVRNFMRVTDLSRADTVRTALL